MISLIEDFNSISLHDPFQYPHIMELYSHIPEITELDNRGYTIQRPLFSQSDIPYFINVPVVTLENFKWDSEFIYPVLLHHNNTLAVKHLELIPKYILDEVRKKRCKLILDNVLEGNSIDYLLQPLYESIAALKLPPSQIFYITNNLVAEKIHTKWILDNNIQTPINMVSFMYNVHDIQRLKNVPLYRDPIIKTATETVVSPTFIPALPAKVNLQEEIAYKIKNLETIKHFLKVNRTNREERNLFMLFMNKFNLFEKSLVSFPDFPLNCSYPTEFAELKDDDNVESLLKKLPFDIDESDRSNHGPPGFGLNEFDADLPFNPVHYRNSFISIVMCAFPFDENGCHLHSSTFNPIYCGHPVIQFGPKGHLAELRSRGFKTFNAWWDESYDELDEPWERFNKILEIVKELGNKTSIEMLQMYIEMKEVLQHNSNLIDNYNGRELLKSRILNENVN